MTNEKRKKEKKKLKSRPQLGASSLNIEFNTPLGACQK